MLVEERSRSAALRIDEQKKMGRAVKPSPSGIAYFEGCGVFFVLIRPI